ncbi:MAG TPA: site-specific integrase [Pirellulales bacterium]|jgi:integrase
MRKRRGNGEGSIYQRADGRWCATYSVGYAPNGRRRRQTLFGDCKQGVQDQLSGARSKMLEGAVAEPTKVRLSTFLERWLEDAARPTVRATTHDSYRSVIDNHITPRIGGVMLTKLSPIHVQSLYSDMERDGKSPRLRQLTHAVLRRALKQALRWGLVIRNVCDAVDPPRVAKTEVAALSAEQVQTLLQTAEGDRLYALFVLAIGTGMRMGEIFALQWRNVDLKNARLHVRHTLMELKGKLTLTEPKTDKSRRRIDLPQSAVEALRAHRLKLIAQGFEESPWVFCNSTGGPLRRSHFHFDEFKPLLKRAKLPDMRFHDLRHTSASLLLAAGVHPKVVQERLGHSQIGITLDTYSHVLPTMGIEAASKLDALLRVSTRQLNHAVTDA